MKDSITRRRFLETTAGVAGALAMGCSNAEPNETPPNIVLLMGDDHAWDEVGYNGHPHLKTPVLDEMATLALRQFLLGASYLLADARERAHGPSSEPLRDVPAELLDPAGGGHDCAPSRRRRLCVRAFRQVALGSGEGGVADQSGSDGF